MAPRTALDPTELVEVAFTDLEGNRHAKVKLPRRLISSGSQRARQNWLIQDGQLPDPSAPPLPPTVAEVTEEVQADRQAEAFTAVDALRQQLDEIKAQIDGQPLSHAELVAARQELAEFMLRAADAHAQLVQVEGRGSQIKAELTAIAEPIAQQVAVTAEQQQEVATIQSRVLADLQAQAAALLDALTQDAAVIKAEALETTRTIAAEESRIVAAKVAYETASTFYPACSACTSIDPRVTDARSFCREVWGIERDYVQGDNVKLTREDGIVYLSYKGPAMGWAATADSVDKVVVATGPTILDQSPKVTASFSQSGSGGGGGVEQISARRATFGTSVQVADSSNWQFSGGEVRGGFISLTVQLLDGSLAGRTETVLIAFNVDSSGHYYSEFAMTGSLASIVQVNFSAQLQSATAPAGYTGSFPVGATRVVAFVQVVPAAGSAAGAASQVALSGQLFWNLPGGTGGISQDGSAVPKPLWWWV